VEDVRWTLCGLLALCGSFELAERCICATILNANRLNLIILIDAKGTAINDCRESTLFSITVAESSAITVASTLDALLRLRTRSRDEATTRNNARLLKMKFTMYGHLN